MALEEKLLEIKNNENIRVVIIRGSGGKAFVAGADIEEMKDMSFIDAKNFAKLGHRVFTLIESINKPFIAAIDGFALGGGNELAMSCDLRFATEKSKFGQPEVSLGIIPGFGGTQRLTELVGPTMAKELIYTGETINAKKACEIGLINRVVKNEELMDIVKNIAKNIASNAPLAIGFAKEAILNKQKAAGEKDLDFESNLFALCFNTRDQKLGMDAFLKREKIDYKGK